MRKDSLGLAKQAVFGTKVTAMEQFPPVEAVTIKDAGEQIQAEETTGNRFPSRMEKGVKGWEITAKGSLRPQSAPRIISAHMGAPTKTNPVGGEATAYSYLFDPVANDPVLHSILATMPDPSPAIVALFFDAIGSSLTLTAEPSGYLSFESAFYAADYDGTQAAPAPVRDTSKRWTFDQIHVFASVDGGAETEIPSAAWSIAFHNAPDTASKALGQRKLYDLKAGNGSCDVQFTPKTNLGVEFARALQDDPAAVKLRMTATGAQIGAGGTSYKCEAIVYLCEYLEAPANIAAGSRLNSIPVKARAAYDSASGKFVTVEIVNTTNNAA